MVNYLHGTTTRLKRKDKLVLLSRELCVGGCHLTAVGNGLVDVCLGHRNLLLVLLLVLAELRALQVGLEEQIMSDMKQENKTDAFKIPFWRAYRKHLKRKAYLSKKPTISSQCPIYVSHFQLKAN